MTPLASPRKLWAVTFLLVTSVTINYIDRGNLSVAAPLIKDELGISAAKLGTLLSAFFWSYASFQLVSGWLVDRFGARLLMAAGFLLWSAATAATGLATGLASLLVLRLVLGVGESAAYPVYSNLLAIHYGEKHRGLANALIDVGNKAGPLFSTLVGGMLVSRIGWRPFFVVLGLGAMPWLICWLKWLPPAPPVSRANVGGLPKLGEIIARKSMWATAFGLFCSSYFWYFLLTWLPFYLVRERHFTMDEMSVVGALPFACTASGTLIAAWLSFRSIDNGASPTFVRKLCTSGGLGVAAVIVAVPWIHDNMASMAVLMLASASYGVYTSSHWAIAQTLAGPLASGRWTGIANFVANLAGVVAPLVTGAIVERTGQFLWAFCVTAVIVLAGASIYLFGLGKIEPETWQPPPTCSGRASRRAQA